MKLKVCECAVGWFEVLRITDHNPGCCFHAGTGMRVLLLSHYALPHYGGIEVLVDREAKLLAAAGHDVVHVASNVGSEEQTSVVPRLHVHRMPAWNWPERRLSVPWPVFSPTLAPTIASYVRWCDVVHAHGLLYLGSIFALASAKLYGKPSILTEHSGIAWFPPGLRRMVQRIAMMSLGRIVARLAGRCYAHHDRVISLLKQLAGPRGCVSYLQNPIDRSLFRPPTEGERDRARLVLGWHPERPVVLFVGRLLKSKGIDLLLKARNPSFDLVFCGSGDPSIIKPYLGPGISYLHPRPQSDLISLYHAADVLALPSRSEGGFPLVAQEALACGLPVLLGDDPGFARFRGCYGLTFCNLTLLSKHGSELNPLLQNEKRVSLDSFLPNEMWWLNQLYGDALFDSNTNIRPQKDG
jgi:D-inositol-3-phosphate glycosyltransferase